MQFKTPTKDGQKVNIDNGVKMPDPLKARKESRNKGKSKYGFHLLEVGDSILFRGREPMRESATYEAMRKWNERIIDNLAASKVEGGIRVWRVK